MVKRLILAAILLLGLSTVSWGVYGKGGWLQWEDMWYDSDPSVSSTTKVTNLNADLFDGHDWSEVATSIVSTVTKSATYSVTTADFGKSIRMNSGGTVTFNLPSVGAAEDGALLGFVKCAAGKFIAKAADSDKIADSGAGGTIYNDVSTQTFATISLEYVHLITTWVIRGAHGTFTTTN